VTDPKSNKTVRTTILAGTDELKTSGKRALRSTVLDPVICNLLQSTQLAFWASGADYLKSFTPDPLHALVMLFLNAHQFVVLIWELFFGSHLIVLG
jgi:hypothetical protein